MTDENSQNKKTAKPPTPPQSESQPGSRPDIQPGYKTHVFICTNGGDNPQKCASKGSEGLRRNLKDQCAPIYGKSVRINAAGCLGYCEHGIASVIYRENQPAEWNLKLTSDSQEIILHSLKKEGSR